MSRSGSERSRTALLIAVTACFWAALYLYVPILSPYAEVAGAPMRLVGLIVSSYGFSQLVLRIPVGIWSDRIGRRKPFIVAGFVISAGSAAWLALAGGPWEILAARALTGVSATMWVVITVLFSSYFSPERAGYAMSLIMFTNTISQLAATLLGGLIAEWYGWTAPFWGAVFLGALGFILSTRIEEVETRKMGLSLGELARVGRERLLLFVSGLGALYQVNTFVTVYGFTPNYAVELGASKAELGWLSLISTLPTALATLAGGSVLAKRFSEYQLVVGGFVLITLSTFAIPYADSMFDLYWTQAVGGIGRGLVFPVLMALSIKQVPEQKRATAMGFFQSIYAIGMFGGPALGGVVAERLSLEGAFVTAGFALLAGAAASALWLPRLAPGARSVRGSGAGAGGAGAAR